MCYGTFFSYIRKDAREKEIPIEKVLKEMTELGLAYTDLAFQDLQDLGAKNLAGLLKDFAIKPSSAYHFLSLPHEGKVLSEPIKEKTKEHLSAYAEAEISLVMPMPILDAFSDKELAKDAQITYLAYLTEQAKPYGISIAVENFSDPKNPLSTPDGLLDLFQNIPTCGFVLDTGNFWFHHIDLLNAQKQLAEKIVHVHFQDFLENPAGHLTIKEKTVEGVAIGNGFLPIAQSVNHLKEIGYQGAYNIEISHNTNTLDRVKQSLKNLRTTF